MPPDKSTPSLRLRRPDKHFGLRLPAFLARNLQNIKTRRQGQRQLYLIDAIPLPTIRQTGNHDTPHRRK
jgi:hypothetical protein